MQTPTQRYYLAMEGRWRGAWRGEVQAGRAPWMRAAQHRALAWLTQLWPAVLETSVTSLGPAAWRHTTRFSWLGFPLLWGEEELTGAEGVTLRGWRRQAPFFLREDIVGSAQVRADVSGADYELPWLDTVMRQSTFRRGDDLEIVQEPEAFRAVVLLRRLPGSPRPG